MKPIVQCLAVGLVMWALSGCAATPAKSPAGDPSLPEIDVLQLKENSDEALKLAQENKLEMQSLESKVRELDSRISSLGDEVANLPLGKLDEVSQQLALITEQLRSLEEKVGKVPPPPPPKKDLSTFSPSALAPAPGAPLAKAAAAKPADSSKAQTPESAKGKDAGKNPSKAPPREARKPGASDAEAAMYKKAFDLFYARDYGQAIAKFEELLQKFPAGTYADNCNYWIGECHFALGNFAKAIACFRKVLTFSETEKADDAQLKLGYCYLRLGDRKQAAEEFKKVVSLYPESEYTERAKEELSKLE